MSLNKKIGYSDINMISDVFEKYHFFDDDDSSLLLNPALLDVLTSVYSSFDSSIQNHLINLHHIKNKTAIDKLP
jgi:hypothetical protein